MAIYVQGLFNKIIISNTNLVFYKKRCIKSIFFNYQNRFFLLNLLFNLCYPELEFF